MIKMMIAEDEALERKALSFLIEKFYKGHIHLIGEAVNGKDAMEKALELQPDIILMDIQMPHGDGLVASQFIKDRLKDTEIIILTAYDKFDYAKKAVNIGVHEYLLKPVANDELFKAMDKVIQKIQDKKKDRVSRRELNKRVKKLTPFLEKEMITEMIYGHGFDEKFDEYKKTLNITNEYFQCLVFRITVEEDLSDKILMTIKNKLRFLLPEVIGHIVMKDMVFILFYDKSEDLQLNTEIKELIFEIKDYIHGAFHVEGDLGLGSPYKEPSKLYLSYQEAKSQLKNKTNNFNKGYIELDYPYENETILCGKIINQDLEGAMEVFDRILDYFTINQQRYNDIAIKKRCKELCLVLNRSLIHFFSHSFESFSIKKVEEDIEGFLEISLIRDYMKTLFKEIILMIEDQKKDRSIQVIQQVKDYILENYKKDISLPEIGDYIGLSPYYLSKLFKRVEKINFKDYLIKVRMEIAKQMLREQKRSIKEVALDVGYSDPNYFSRAFKKYVGISATDYIQK